MTYTIRRMSRAAATPTHRSMGWKLGSADWNAAAKPSMRCSAFPEKSMPGASREPNHFAVRQYKKYKLAAGKTAKSINISCGARLAPFDIQELREITMYDELELDTLGDRKTALFLIMSDTDSRVEKFHICVAGIIGYWLC